MIKRDVLRHLKNWANSKLRAPLILRGPRQVGKSFVINEFGKEFEHYVVINLERQPSMHQLFQGDINITNLLEQLSLYTQTPIIPGKTLLFIDEIQECEAAINYLRYFKEEFDQLHVIAAGSLIDFKLKAVGLPVGRVDFLYLCPLSFSEYLTACGENQLRKYLLTQQNDPLITNKLQQLFKTYLWLGGMPEVVQAWIDHQEVNLCQKIQNRLLMAYRGDFEKYTKQHQMINIEHVFNNIPSQLGSKFKYVNIEPNARSIQLKQALLLLEKAGIAHLCYHSSAQHPPLSTHRKENHFKVFFSDIGLAQQLLHASPKDWMINPLNIHNLGALAEQFVAQEIIAYRSLYEKERLYYWHREAKNSNAEVDFVLPRNDQLIPIEVKSGKTGAMKSMHLYLESHPNSSYGLKISEGNFLQQHKIHEIPLYGIESWLTKETYDE